MWINPNSKGKEITFQTFEWHGKELVRTEAFSQGNEPILQQSHLHCNFPFIIIIFASRTACLVVQVTTLNKNEFSRKKIIIYVNLLIVLTYFVSKIHTYMTFHNSCCCSWACTQTFLSSQLHTDEVNGSMQWKLTHKLHLCVKTVDDCNNSY